MPENDKRLSLEIEAMYGELRRLAASQLRRERADHTLSATALVNEAYLNLSASHAAWHDKNHFLGIAAHEMRQILVNHALAHRAEKRGGEWLKLTLTSSAAEIDAQHAKDGEYLDVVGLNDALEMPAADRAAVLEARCGGDAALLAKVRAFLHAASDTADFLSSSGTGMFGKDAMDIAVDHAANLAGKHFGTYHLLREIGRGDISVVYLAEHTDGAYQTHCIGFATALPANSLAKVPVDCVNTAFAAFV